MADLIDRQEAIDALRQQAETMSEWSNRYAEQRKGVLTAVNIVEDLPSAQPETTTVTIGRTRGGTTMWYECDACGEPVDQKDCYCRNCGRKLKHE